MQRSEVLIIGAGLAGLCTALRLRRPYLILEKESEPGGIARSIKVGASTYDFTGHLLHLRNPETEDLVARLLPDAMRPRQRKAAIYSHGCFVPYPFQANFHPLPRAVVRECLLGFIRAREARLLGDAAEAGDFRQWAAATFGSGICAHFMYPYNEKLFRTDLEELSADWVSWSVPQPELETVVDGALGVTAEGLGYNPSFLYPREGGIEALPRALAGRIAGIESGCRVTGIDPQAKAAFTADGRRFGYDSLVSTMPLPELLRMLRTGDPRPVEWAARLRWVNVYNLNLTLRGQAPWPWQWLYLPELEFRCYRIGVYSNISPALTDEGHFSVYAEVSYLPGEAPREEIVRGEILDDLARLGLFGSSSEISDELALRIEPAYVIHDPLRARTLPEAMRWLAANGIISTGRWGAWDYGCMEDAMLQGLRAAETIGSA